MLQGEQGGRLSRPRSWRGGAVGRGADRGLDRLLPAATVAQSSCLALRGWTWDVRRIAMGGGVEGGAAAAPSWGGGEGHPNSSTAQLGCSPGGFPSLGKATRSCRARKGQRWKFLERKGCSRTLRDSESSGEAGWSPGPRGESGEIEQGDQGGILDQA